MYRCQKALRGIQLVPYEALCRIVYRQRASQATQKLLFKAATGYAFTIVRAGFAFTMTTFPKTSLLPALVAGLVRVLILTRPGIVKMPVLLTSLVAISAIESMIFAAV